MLSFRVISGTARGISALTNSQFVRSTSYKPGPTCTIQPNNDDIPKNFTHLSTGNSRPLTTSSIQSQALRVTKINKINGVLSERSVDLPVRPKKPSTPWLLFVRERKDQILARHGSKMKAPELSIELSKEWQQIDKSRYEQEYQRLHDEYKKQINNYEASLTDDQREVIKEQKLAKRQLKALRQLKRTHPPVLPRNSANLYCHERSKMSDIKELMKVHKPADVFSLIFKEYRSLSASEKQKYVDMQEEDRGRYQHEFLLWYEGVQNNENLGKAALEQAEAMRIKLKF